MLIFGILIDCMAFTSISALPTSAAIRSYAPRPCFALALTNIMYCAFDQSAKPSSNRRRFSDSKGSGRTWARFHPRLGTSSKPRASERRRTRNVYFLCFTSSFVDCAANILSYAVYKTCLTSIFRLALAHDCLSYNTFFSP